MKDQQRLSFVTKSLINPQEFPSLRGIISKWQGDTIKLTFFFDGEISENIKENASVLATEILAQFPYGNLEEEYIRIDFPEDLPTNRFLIYVE